MKHISSQRTNNNDYQNQFIQNSQNDTSKSRIVYAKESHKDPTIVALGLDDTKDELRQTILKNPDDEKEYVDDSIERSRENSNPRFGVHVAEVRTEMPQNNLNESSLENRLIHKASGSSAQFI